MSLGVELVWVLRAGAPRNAWASAGLTSSQQPAAIAKTAASAAAPSGRRLAVDGRAVVTVAITRPPDKAMRQSRSPHRRERATTPLPRGASARPYSRPQLLST